LILSTYTVDPGGATVNLRRRLEIYDTGYAAAYASPQTFRANIPKPVPYLQEM